MPHTKHTVCGFTLDLHLLQIDKAVGRNAEWDARIRFDRLDSFFPGKPIYVYDTQVRPTVPALGRFVKPVQTG